ncbi:immunoglobulin lambda-1 light chain-like [Scyliorhinus canicula]|uniref:immunoglobulin lambda-1 light chain-like n=1 Tax=Scyliorhinus canicula TaxID=7830 RepID=UPI0018F5E5BC|nr:immunoglobulin lambda-1 light chain-like [Scyliorhinus canicula]
MVITFSNMIVRALLQSSLILGMISTVNCYADTQVLQRPQHKIVMVGQNITITCAFTPLSDNSEVNIFWWRLGENVFMQPTSDMRKHVLKRKGQSTFQLLDVRLHDAGIYYCGIKEARARMNNGTGSTFVVHAVPHTPTILWKTPDENANVYLHLVCETVDFYPEDVTLQWYKGSSRIITGIQTTKRLNKAGLYQATSVLHESQPVLRGTPYTCLVSHTTLQAPKISVHLVTGSDPVRNNFAEAAEDNDPYDTTLRNSYDKILTIAFCNLYFQCIVTAEDGSPACEETVIIPQDTDCVDAYCSRQPIENPARDKQDALQRFPIALECIRGS